MPTNLQTLTAAETANSVVTRPEAPALDKVLSAIAADAAAAPETYLRETEVPHGGE